MCDCIEKTNEVLEMSGIQAKVATMINLSTGKSRMLIELDKTSKAKVPAFAATYCPICGKGYGE